jgi:hypothetical protein
VVKTPAPDDIDQSVDERIIALQTPPAIFNRNPGLPRDFCGKILVEKIPTQPLRDCFTDGAGTRTKLLINEKELFHIIVGH